MLRRWQVEDLGRLASRSQPATTSQGSPPATTSQGLQPATPPTASQEPDGEWVLVDIPDGRTKLTTGEWEEQDRRIRGVGGVLERANLRSDSFTTEAYVRKLSWSLAANHGGWTVGVQRTLRRLHRSCEVEFVVFC